MKDVMEITKSLVSRKVEMINKIGNMPHITGDGDRIVQIMYNLIGNACECQDHCLIVSSHEWMTD